MPDAALLDASGEPLHDKDGSVLYSTTEWSTCRGTRVAHSRQTPHPGEDGVVVEVAWTQPNDVSGVKPTLVGASQGACSGGSQAQRRRLRGRPVADPQKFDAQANPRLAKKFNFHVKYDRYPRAAARKV